MLFSFLVLFSRYIDTCIYLHFSYCCTCKLIIYRQYTNQICQRHFYADIGYIFEQLQKKEPYHYLYNFSSLFLSCVCTPTTQMVLKLTLWGWDHQFLTRTVLLFNCFKAHECSNTCVIFRSFCLSIKKETEIIS